MKKGQILIAAIFVLVVVAVLGIAAAAILSTESFSAARNLQGIQALNIAEAGIRFTAATSLAADANWSDNSDFGPVSLNPGTFSVHYVSKAVNTCVLESTGTVNGVARTVRVNMMKGWRLQQFTDYGLYAGEAGDVGDTVNFYNQSKIIGDFYYYGPIRIYGSRPPACQTGGVIKSTSITPSPATGIPNYYASWESINSITPPVWDNSYYDNWLTIAYRTGVPDLILTGTQNLNLNGGTQWYNHIYLYTNSTITGPGTLCAISDVRTQDQVRFIGNVRVVARGHIHLRSYTSFESPVELIARGDLNVYNSVVIPPQSISYSRDDVNLYNSARVQGSLLAPFGKITSINNGTIRGLVYADEYQGYNNSSLEGGSVFEEVGSFYNDSTIIQNASLLPQFLPSGLSGEAGASGFNYSNWREVF